MTTLKQAAKLLSGGTPSKSNAAYWEGSIPWVSGKDMKQFLLEDSEDHVSEEAAGDGSKIAPPGSTLLLVRGMSLHDEIRACFIERPMAFNQDVKAIVPLPGVDPAFLAYSVEGRKEELLELVDSASHGTGRILTPALEQIELYLPPINEQRNIAGCLYSIDRRIALNEKLNAALEATAAAVFKSWFVDFDPVVAKSEGRKPFGMTEEIAALFPDRFDANGLPEGWLADSLDGIATFKNGLAMQKFPPKGSGTLPVIKIAELRTGNADGADSASADIPREVVIDDGDVIFSWSGTLLVKLWCGGKGALNQHLFKVTSERYPKWFYYFWTQTHLPDFIDIADDKKTTMGHIKRHHLTDAKVCVPNANLIEAADGVIGPILDRIVLNNLQNRALRNLRDAILPGLVSGELQIRDVEREIAGVAG